MSGYPLLARATRRLPHIVLDTGLKASDSVGWRYMSSGSSFAVWKSKVNDGPKFTDFVRASAGSASPAPSPNPSAGDGHKGALCLRRRMLRLGVRSSTGLTSTRSPSHWRAVYLETYGCQMNVSDSEVVAGVLQSSGCAAAWMFCVCYMHALRCTRNMVTTDSLLRPCRYQIVGAEAECDVLLLNTCAIRDKAEQRVWQRLRGLRSSGAGGRRRVVGVLGCMAERLKTKLLEEEGIVDLVVVRPALQS
jgi:uncharacterized protein UPF0004